jgi:cytoskeletal protein CcmA (bactofilin family)
VHGEITAQMVYVRGRVMGPVTGTHVHIHSGAHVEGNVTNETLSIENGAYIFGSIRHTGMQTASAAPVAQNLQSLTSEPPKQIVPQLEIKAEQNNVRPLKALKPRA